MSGYQKVDQEYFDRNPIRLLNFCNYIRKIPDVNLVMQNINIPVKENYKLKEISNSLNSKELAKLKGAALKIRGSFSFKSSEGLGLWIAEHGGLHMIKNLNPILLCGKLLAIAYAHIYAHEQKIEHSLGDEGTEEFINQLLKHLDPIIPPEVIDETIKNLQNWMFVKDKKNWMLEFIVRCKFTPAEVSQQMKTLMKFHLSHLISRQASLSNIQIEDDMWDDEWEIKQSFHIAYMDMFQVYQKTKDPEDEVRHDPTEALEWFERDVEPISGKKRRSYFLEQSSDFEQAFETEENQGLSVEVKKKRGRPRKSTNSESSPSINKFSDSETLESPKQISKAELQTEVGTKKRSALVSPEMLADNVKKLVKKLKPTESTSEATSIITVAQIEQDVSQDVTSSEPVAFSTPSQSLKKIDSTVEKSLKSLNEDDFQVSFEDSPMIDGTEEQTLSLSLNPDHFEDTVEDPLKIDSCVGETLKVSNQDKSQVVFGNPSNALCNIKSDSNLQRSTDSSKSIKQKSDSPTVHQAYVSCEKSVPDSVLVNDKMLLQDFSDIIFTVEGRQIRSHKHILAQKSSVFSAMFKRDTSEDLENVIEVTDVKFNIFQEMLRYVYTGKVENIEDIADELLYVAGKYSIEDLKNKCEKVLLPQITLDNVMSCVETAVKCNTSIYKTKVINFIVANKKLFVKKSEFKLLSKKYPDFISELFEIIANN